MTTTAIVLGIILFWVSIISVWVLGYSTGRLDGMRRALELLPDKQPTKEVISFVEAWLEATLGPRPEPLANQTPTSGDRTSGTDAENSHELNPVTVRRSARR